MSKAITSRLFERYVGTHRQTLIYHTAVTFSNWWCSKLVLQSIKAKLKCVFSYTHTQTQMRANQQRSRTWQEENKRATVRTKKENERENHSCVKPAITHTTSGIYYRDKIGNNVSLLHPGMKLCQQQHSKLMPTEEKHCQGPSEPKYLNDKPFFLYEYTPD